jgi:hypothetical protein
MEEEDFAIEVEQLIRAAIPGALQDEEEMSWEDFHRPLLSLVRRAMIAGGQQNPHNPGQVRIDTGLPQPYGGLRPNSDAVLVIDFDWVKSDEDLRFLAKYDLAEELLRYAELGEKGWDLARQIDQLERTIVRLKTEAAKREWELPEPPQQYGEATHWRDIGGEDTP